MIPVHVTKCPCLISLRNIFDVGMNVQAWKYTVSYFLVLNYWVASLVICVQARFHVREKWFCG